MMAAYTYRCKKCNTDVTLYHSMSDNEPKFHTGCGGKLIKLISTGIGVIFKGSWPGKDIANGKKS